MGGTITDIEFKNKGVGKAVLEAIDLANQKTEKRSRFGLEIEVYTIVKGVEKIIEEKRAIPDEWKNSMHSDSVLLIKDAEAKEFLLEHGIIKNS